MGGYLGEDWGEGPPKIGGGDGPCIRPPMFRGVVLSDACESTNRIKERCHQGIFLRNRGFSRQEMVIYVIFHISDSKDHS